MASLTLYSGSLDTAPYVLPCFDLDFMTAFSHRGRNNWDFFNGRHVWTQADPWIGFSVAFDPSFTDAEGVRYDLLDGLTGHFPFPDPKWRYNFERYVDLDPSSYDTFEVTSESEQPDDWETDYLSYFRYISSGDLRNTYRVTSKGETWEDFRRYVCNSVHDKKAYKMKSPCGNLFISHGGLHDFTFGVRTTVCAGDGVNKNFIVSGMVGDNYMPLTDVGDTGGNPFAYRDLNTGNQLFNAWSAVRSSGGKTNQGSRRVQTYPVAFTMPKNTVLPAGSPASDYPSITFGADTEMLGIMCVRFTAYGTPEKCSLCVMSKNMWAAKGATSGAGAGSDTIPTGGKGKQTSSKYNPSAKTITKNTAGGLLTDPTASAGFVIYKFTPDQFTEFLSKVYTETALPSIGNTIAGVAGVMDFGISDNLSALATGRGWSNTENIVFVKTSPVNFPSVGRQLAKLSIGVLGIVPSEAVQVVTQYIVNGSHDFIFPNPAQWFTDVEPYASNQIYFPLAGSVALPPSIINGASGKINYAYNLLNNSCGYSLFIGKDGGYLYLAKNGECAKSADCVIPGRDISGTIGAVGALAATGIATLATGGTTAPALLTSALGAATEAVHEANDLSITNMPPASSGSPYDDTVYGGLRDIVLYRAKAERFTSGESDVSNPLRSQVIGTASGFYVSALSDLKDGSYVSCHEVMLHESAGMTKAESDKIRAFLSEGVYI